MPQRAVSYTCQVLVGVLWWGGGGGLPGAHYGSWGSDRISMSPFSPFNKHAEDLSQRSMDVGVQSPLRSARIQLQAD